MDKRVQLVKTLKPQWVWAIALGSAIGWGSFILPADYMATAGPLGAVLGFSIGALLMMVIAVSYGLMINQFPVSGGEFAYAYFGFGRNHAYVCGWFLTLGYICIVALNASALALLAKYVLPGIAKQGLMYSIAGWDVYFGEVVIASLALIIFAYLNIRGATISGRLQYIFCILLVAGVGILAVAMFFHPDTSINNLQPVFKPEIPAWAAVIAIVAIAPWAYVGFDNVPQAAEEFNFPPRKAFMLIILALFFAAAIYSLNIFTTALGMPWQDLVQGQPIWGTGDVISGALGGAGMLILSLALCMGIFTGLNGFYNSSSRLLFAMSRGQILPASFYKLHTKYKTPYIGVLFTCLICLVAPWFGREVLLWVVDMSSIGVTIAYIYTCYVAYKLCKWSHRPSTGDETSLTGSVSSVKKGLALLGGLSGFVFLGLLLVPGSPAFLGTPSLVALIVWVCLGAIFYMSKGKAYRKIPKENLDYLILGKKSISDEKSDRPYTPGVDV